MSPRAETVPQTYIECMEIVRRHQEEYPVMVVDMAKDMGLNVYKIGDWDPDDVAGQILKSAFDGGPSGYAIYVNQSHGLERRRFTIAHEIGHFILHREQIGDGIEETGLYQSRLNSAEEQQATHFAIHEILIPDNLLKRAISSIAKPRELTIPRLAEMFSVPNSLMSIKLGVPYEGAVHAEPGAERG